MAGGWGDSNRRGELPKNWATLRAKVRARAAGQCEATMKDGTRCPDAGNECHHLGDKNDHTMASLQWICTWHHARETTKQGQRARRPTGRRPSEAHPGLKP